MSFLNPEDIKSMSVLKDAATAAIYGARAAAGVILIETYRGTKSKPKITFSVFGVLTGVCTGHLCHVDKFFGIADVQFLGYLIHSPIS